MFLSLERRVPLRSLFQLQNLLKHLFCRLCNFSRLFKNSFRISIFEKTLIFYSNTERFESTGFDVPLYASLVGMQPFLTLFRNVLFSITCCFRFLHVTISVAESVPESESQRVGGF